MSTTHTIVGSPLGDLTVVGKDGALTGLYFAKQWRRPDPASFGSRTDAGFEEVRRQLDEYFAGERTRFDLLLAPAGDEFQLRVWHELAKIPYGETRTYGDIARRLGHVSLAQEVGAANGRNPLCVIVPCHRVVGANGSLTGYAGGLHRKRQLLELENTTEARLF